MAEKGAVMTEGSFETVYTVIEYFDGPRFGVAHFRGAPHVYRAIFSEQDDDWLDGQFELSPLSPELFLLAMEDWEIWKRFEDRYRRGEVEWSGADEDWGALPDDLPRHHELQAQLLPGLQIDPTRRFVAKGEFRPLASAPAGIVGVLRPLEVRWTQLPEASAI